MYWVIKVLDPFGNECLASTKWAYEEGGEIYIANRSAVRVFSEESKARRYMLNADEAGLYNPNVAWVAPLDMKWFKRVGRKEWDAVALDVGVYLDLASRGVTYLPAREFASKLYSLRFDGGRVIVTPPADEVMRIHGVDPRHLLTRHCSGDWGDQSFEEKQAWDRALENGASSLMSVYSVGGEEVWLLTDVERLSTVFLVPEVHY